MKLKSEVIQRSQSGHKAGVVMRAWRWLTYLNIAIALSYVGLMVIAARQDLLWRADFTAYYTGAAMVRDGHGTNLYDLEAQMQCQQRILEGRIFMDGLLPFNYPPYFAVILVPLTYFSLSTAFWLWTIGEIVCLVWILLLIWRLTPSWISQGRWLFIGVILAFPPLMRTVLQGTSSLIALLGMLQIYYALKQGDAAAGGIWLVIGAVRPQTVFPAGVFTLLQRRWQMLLGTALAGLFMVGLTTLVLGGHIWLDFINSVGRSGQLYDHLGVYPEVMYNLKGTLALWLGSEYGFLINRLSLWGFLLYFLGMILLWWRKMSPDMPMFDLKLALGLVLGMFFSLHLNPHDGLLLIVPLLLIVNYLHSRGLSDSVVMMLMGVLPTFLLASEFFVDDLLNIHGTVLVMIGLIIWMTILLLKERDDPGYHLVTNS